MFKRGHFSPPLFCLVCGVDSGPVRTFLWVFIGALVGTSLLFLAWSFATGRLGRHSGGERLAIEAEEKGAPK